MAANRLQLQAALHNTYDRLLFAKEVLSPVFGSGFSLSSGLVAAPIIPNQSESAVIDKVWIYGNIRLEDGTEITCYEIRLQPTVRIERSRVAIQHYVRKLLMAGQAALINFIAPSNQNTWRLTLVAKDSELTEQGVKEKATHAKRYTFLLGPLETCKTAAERFETLSTERTIDFESLVKAFSVEKMSKEFFNEYKLHYERFVYDLISSNSKKSAFKNEKAIRDFTKKLLGRIVFIYFVQKKGWMGATSQEYTDGNSDFMMNLFKSSGGNQTFYPVWLTKLFFETLNNEEEKRKDGDFTMPDGKTVKIPYLNGGLFDADEYDKNWVIFKSELFHNPNNDDDPKYRGFLDFLNAFNFTVNEDSPDDHTVAVDPEMLGHIFENLLEDNKDKGAFYTPKEIVHYMCQESLIEYLATHLARDYTVYKAIGDDQFELFGAESTTVQLKMIERLGEKALNREDVDWLVKQKDISNLKQQQIKRVDELLDSVKICDPAIGSGAFPMGLLQEIFGIKEVIAYTAGAIWNPAEVKLNIIQNSIYGVDIEKGAVDIARLRFWLSLVVDEDKPKALPNLDYKIVEGDSLVSKFDGEIVEIDWDRKSSVGKADEYVNNVQRLLVEVAEKQKTYFKPETKNKKKLTSEIRNLKLELLINQFSFNKEQFKGKTEHKGGFMPSAKDIKHNSERELKIAVFDKLISRLKALQKDLDASFNHFDWKLDFPEVLNPYLMDGNCGFDIVIANPPYVGQKGHKELFEPLINDPNFEKKMDYWYFFLHKSHTLSKQSGVNTFITPNYWITTQGGKKLRNRIVMNYSIVEYINFNENAIFEAGVHTNIFLLKKDETPNPKIKCTIYQNKYSENIFSFRNLELNFYADQSIILNSWTGFVHFLPAEISNIINQLYENCEKLSDNESEGEKKHGVVSGKKVTNGICNINQGLLTGKDRYIDKEKGINSGVFILTSQEISDLNLTKNELNYIKPFFKNSDIRKYKVETNPRHFFLHINKIENEMDLVKLKNIYNHLSSFKEILMQRSINGVLESAYQKGKWWALTTDRPNINFGSEKILCPQRSNTNMFGYSNEEWYAASDVFYITSNRTAFDLKYILSILTSRITFFWLYYMGKRKGEALELTLEPLQFIPIKKITTKEQTPFIIISDYILYLKDKTHNNVTDQFMPNYFEQIIDGMVYELYFPELLKKHNREIIKHLGEIPEITDSMNDEKKMEIIRVVYSRLYNEDHPVRVNLDKMKEEIEEIRIIEGLD